MKCRLAISGITVDVFGEISKCNCGLPGRRQVAADHRVDETGGRCGRVDNNCGFSFPSKVCFIAEMA